MKHMMKGTALGKFLTETFGPKTAPKRIEFEENLTVELEMAKVGQHIKEMRIVNKWSQAELAKKIDLSRAQLNRIEMTGRTTMHTYLLLKRVLNLKPL